MINNCVRTVLKKHSFKMATKSMFALSDDELDENEKVGNADVEDSDGANAKTTEDDLFF